jgi:sigma-B regulation protein RsbU (phosphoserine phosphatase)
LGDGSAAALLPKRKEMSFQEVKDPDVEADRLIARLPRGLIVLVDDDEFYCGLANRVLTDEGYVVATALGGAEGIALYRDRSPELVITDMNMPGVDGCEVIRTVRKMNARAPIVAVSGAAPFKGVNALKVARELGASAVVCKLDPIETLVFEVNALLKVPA